MTRYRVTSSGTIRARPTEVYEVIADYKQHHPKIVPPEYFPKLEVTAGGVGAGTRTRVQMRVLGTTREFEQIITEPELGRVLIETEPDGFSVTTFTVESVPAAVDSTRLTICTEFTVRPGLRGVLERLVTSVVLPRIYRKELARVADYVADRARDAARR